MARKVPEGIAGYSAIQKFWAAMKTYVDLNGGKIDTIQVDGIDLPIADKTVNITGKANASDLTNLSNTVSGHTSDLTIHVTSGDKTAWNAKYDKPSTGIPKTDLASGVQTSLGKADNSIQSSEKGANSGVATLDSSGKVPSSQLPSYVDDVIEVNSYSDLPTTGEAGKIYITKDTNKTYRWSGSTYVEISASLALGETSGTAYEGSKGKANADNIAELQTDVSSHTGNSTIHVTSSDKATWGNKYDKPSTGIPSSDMTSAVQLSLSKADSALQEHQDITGKEDKTNKVSSWSSTTNNTHYPGEKLVKDSLDAKQNTVTISNHVLAF